MADILYLCDRNLCPICTSDCLHTTDPKHARNFIPMKDGREVDDPNDATYFLEWGRDHTKGEGDLL